MNSRERKRLWRMRQRAGLRVYAIEADELALADKMVLAGYLSPLAADDPEKQRQALERAVADMLGTRSDAA